MEVNNQQATILKIFLMSMCLYLVYLGFSAIQSSKEIYKTTVDLVTPKEASANTAAIEKICTTCIKEGYAQGLAYFVLAIGIIFVALLLPRLQSIMFGGFNITLRELKSDIENIKSQNNELQESLVETGGGKGITADKLEDIRTQVKKKKVSNIKSSHNEDPQKGRWGTSAVANGRRLRAEVKPSDVSGLYSVVLYVESTNPNGNPLTGFVQYHLHPTFKNQDPIIAVKNGQATLRLKYVYGGFTVGAEADDGKTKLELDLASLPDAPEEFQVN